MTETSLEADHMARFSYQTNTETADQASRGSLITDDSVLVHATVSLDTSSLAGFIRAIVLGGVPGAVRVVVGPLFDSLTSGLLAQLASLVQPTAYGYVQVRHHALPRLLPDRTCEGRFPGHRRHRGARPQGWGCLQLRWRDAKSPDRRRSYP